MGQGFKLFQDEAMSNVDVNNLLQWYVEQQRRFPILTSLATNIFGIPPTQVEN